MGLRCEIRLEPYFLVFEDPILILNTNSSESKSNWILLTFFAAIFEALFFRIVGKKRAQNDLKSRRMFHQS